MTARRNPQRHLRVGEEIRHALAAILQRGDLRDPALADAPVTVSEVRVSADLRHAVAFVLPLGGRNEDAVLAALCRAAPFLRMRLGQEVKLRFTPALDFRKDTAFDHADRIGRLLQKNGHGRPSGSAADSDADSDADGDVDSDGNDSPDAG